MEEITESVGNKFKEMKLNLITNDKGVIIYETRKIRGWLDCVIVKSETLTDVGLDIEGDYEIMRELQIQGTNIFFPRAQSKAKEPRVYFTTSPERYSLNCPLVISVISNPKKEIQVIVRWI